MSESGPKTPSQVLNALLEGNKRFMESLSSKGSVNLGTKDVYTELSPGTVPTAAVLTCADPRVAPEILFDCAIGDIFVVRVAGNVVHPSNPELVGTIEFGVHELGANVIVVLGHSGCGAVTSAIQAVQENKEFPGSITKVVDTIVPSVRAVKDEPGDLLYNSIVSNVKASIENLKSSAPEIAHLALEGSLMIVGAYYNIDSGEVLILD